MSDDDDGSGTVWYGSVWYGSDEGRRGFLTRGKGMTGRCLMSGYGQACLTWSGLVGWFGLARSIGSYGDKHDTSYGYRVRVVWSGLVTCLV